MSCPPSSAAWRAAPRAVQEAQAHAGWRARSCGPIRFRRGPHRSSRSPRAAPAVISGVRSTLPGRSRLRRSARASMLLPSAVHKAGRFISDAIDVMARSYRSGALSICSPSAGLRRGRTSRLGIGRFMTIRASRHPASWRKTQNVKPRPP
jgi:hypothetical protein